MELPSWVVCDVEAERDDTLHLAFSSGERKIYDARPLLEKAIFRDLRDPKFFCKAKVEYGTVVWSDTVDIAPEHLYENSIPASGKGQGVVRDDAEVEN